ncbi:MAG: phosphoribosylglycinamide formyltransferase [Bacteroidales bacterium]|nr:phosphoribosylglycinamide formyltransferase [Bacteroidales bacterium]
MINLAIFASGRGSNAENIIKYFKDSTLINVSLIITNKDKAFVIEIAKENNIPYIIYNKTFFYDSINNNEIIGSLKEYKIDFIILAGFLLKIPESILKLYNKKIINIHPALLPKYGGKNMYGDNVHNAVINSKEKYSGITIHFVNDNYDEGEIIFQVKCDVLPEDNAESLAKRIHNLEYRYYPEIIEKVVKDVFSI